MTSIERAERISAGGVEVPAQPLADETGGVRRPQGLLRCLTSSSPARPGPRLLRPQRFGGAMRNLFEDCWKKQAAKRLPRPFTRARQCVSAAGISNRALLLRAPLHYREGVPESSVRTAGTMSRNDRKTRPAPRAVSHSEL